MLAVESRNRERKERCFDLTGDPNTTDLFEAPRVVEVRRLQAASRVVSPRAGAACSFLRPSISQAHRRLPQRFVKVKRLDRKPIYTAGVSSGASFAVKFPKIFFSRETLRTLCLP